MTMNDSRWNDFANFKESEFVCPCGKCKSKPMNVKLIAMLQKVRTEFGRSVNITSGYRCVDYNRTLPGHIENSDHLNGCSADFYMPVLCETAEGRGILMGYLRSIDGFKYAYCNGYYMSKEKCVVYNASWMGKAIHVSVE